MYGTVRLALVRKKWIFRDSNCGKYESSNAYSAGRAHDPFASLAPRECHRHRHRHLICSRCRAAGLALAHGFTRPCSPCWPGQRWCAPVSVALWVSPPNRLPTNWRQARSIGSARAELRRPCGLCGAMKRRQRRSSRLQKTRKPWPGMPQTRHCQQAKSGCGPRRGGPTGHRFQPPSFT